MSEAAAPPPPPTGFDLWSPDDYSNFITICAATIGITRTAVPHFTMSAQIAEDNSATQAPDEIYNFSRKTTPRSRRGLSERPNACPGPHSCL